MGGPLSSLVADVLIDRLERWVLKISKYSHHAILWYRYVDDILCIWTGSDLELNLFLRDLNSFRDSISSTMGIGDKALNFLDLTIRLLPDNLDDGLLTPRFSIFQKSTYTGLSINQRSLHPMSHKFASINAAIHRMISLPLSPSERKKETAIIASIATKNGLNVDASSLARRVALRRSLNTSRSEP